MTNSRKYYTLLVNYGEAWEVHFGDYDLQTVKDEQHDVIDNAWHDLRKKDTKVIVTGDLQPEIQAAVDALNGYNPDLIERGER
jgi:hypothetical protein